MIKVDRNAIKVPPDFAHRALEASGELTRRMAGRELSKASQQTRVSFNDTVWLAPDLLPALHHLFGNRCAFCESYLNSEMRRGVAQFRPRERASSMDGAVDALHYWWLAYEWTNLYPICPNCHSAKGTRFPVKGARAQAADGAQTAQKEVALVLDPCGDFDERELQFLADGTVSAATERAHNTIEIFALNRTSLVAARRGLHGQVEQVCNIVLGDDLFAQWSVESLVSAVCAKMPEHSGFLALTRQRAQEILRQSSRAPRRAAKMAPQSKSQDAAPAAVDVAVAAPAEAQAASGAPRPAMARPEESTAAPKTRAVLKGTPATYLPKPAQQGAVWLHRVEVENFKALRRLELEFPAPHPTPPSHANAMLNVAQQSADTPVSEPWLMLLGENGVGKSTLLKAIALAVMPAAQRERFAPNPRSWVTRGSSSDTGIVRLHLTVGSEPVELHFSRKSSRVVVKGELPRMSVLGYGSTRLLPPPLARRPRPERIRVQNLLDARSPLRDAESWLASTEDVAEPSFNLLATSLKTLLSLGDEDEISRLGKGLKARVNGDAGPIRDLSDGYQSVLALAIDMMLNLSKATFDMDSVEGVVLLDELEVHLHPRWKIQIVSALRHLFPRVRFIATTHDPLCVQGIRKGELHIMTRQGKDHDVKVEQFDVPPGARADQILTGAWFGVATTRDPETVKFMRQHSALLQKRTLSEFEKQEFAVLDRVLRQRLDEYIGTEDEQIALQAAADARAGDRERAGEAGQLSAGELREKVLEALRARQAGKAGS